VVARLAADGYAVALACLPEEYDAVAAVAAGFERAVALPADVADEGQVAALARRVRDELGAVQGLVCAAATAVTHQGDWRALTAADWARVLAVNVTGTFLCVRAFFDDLVASGRGSVVAFSSVTPLLGRPGNLHYVTSKAAVIGLTRALAREVGPAGVRVNALAPGAIRTPAEASYGDPEDLARELSALQALARRGEPADVAGAVSFLLGPDSAFVTGQLLVVDGGWVMH
jgi:3-oxoacyl-[acyl-carrier protein] reductase